MNKRTRIALLAIGVAVVASLVYGFWPERSLVEVAAVERGPLEVSLEEEGHTRVADRFVVSAPVSGYIQRLTLEVGDSVGQGDTILELEPLRAAALDPRSRAEADARVAASQAAWRAAEEMASAAQAEAHLAEAEFERIQALFAAGSATRQTLDQTETAHRRAQAQQSSSSFNVEVARYELEAARTALRFAGTANPGGRRIAIESPVSGRVLTIHQESEGVVQAGQPLLEIGDPGALEVVVDVLSSDAVRILPGIPVWFERWGGDAPLEGVVRSVQPVGFTKISALGVEEQRVLVVSDFNSPRSEWRRLGDGYRVIARFVLWQGEQALQVPTSALFRHDGGWAVYAAADGNAELRTVRVAHQNGMNAEIVSGVNEGERVVVHPDDTVFDGAAISYSE